MNFVGDFPVDFLRVGGKKDISGVLVTLYSWQKAYSLTL